MMIEAEWEGQTLQERDNLQAQEWIYRSGQEALKPAGRSFEDPGIPGEALAELIRRALLELDAEPTFANYMIGNVEEPAPSGEQPAPQQRAGLQGLGASTEETPEGAGGT